VRAFLKTHTLPAEVVFVVFDADSKRLYEQELVATQ
jgi:hypothetical protein